MAQQRTGRRFSDILIEAGMIFLAVVLALAAEEWREKQDRRELADRALHLVTEEIRSNLEELERTAPENRERMASGMEVLGRLEAGEETVEADVGLEVSLLSRAAWQSAQMSQAVQYFDLEDVREISEVYEVQALFERVQQGMVDGMREMITTAQADPAAAVRQGMMGFQMLLGLQDSLIEVHRNTLRELEPEPAP